MEPAPGPLFTRVLIGPLNGIRADSFPPLRIGHNIRNCRFALAINKRQQRAWEQDLSIDSSDLSSDLSGDSLGSNLVSHGTKNGT